MTSNGWDLGPWNKLQRIWDSGVRCNRDVIKINLSIFFVEEANILYNWAKFDGIENVWFLVFIKTDALCITTSFDVEDTFVTLLKGSLRPAVFVVSNESSLWVSTESGFAGPRETEQ